MATEPSTLTPAAAPVEPSAAHPAHAKHADHAPAAHSQEVHAAHTAARPPVISADRPTQAPAVHHLMPSPPSDPVPQTPMPPIPAPVMEAHAPHPANVNVPAAAHPHPAPALNHEHSAVQPHVPAQHMPDEQLIVLPAQRAAAEQIEAMQYIAHQIIPGLREGLILTHTNRLGKNLTMDVMLRLQGPAVNDNSALIGREAVEALEKSPDFAAFFHGEHKPHVQAVEGVPDAIEVHIPSLSIERYAALMHKLAAPTHAAHIPPVHAPSPLPIAASDVLPAALPALAADENIGMAPPVIEKVAAIPEAPTAPAKPANVVSNVALQGMTVANDNGLAAAGLAS